MRKPASAPLGKLRIITQTGLMADDTSHTPAQDPLGPFLKRARNSLGISLREVEARTEVTNGYLSQIENQLIAKPSPNVLFELAELYGIDYADLLNRAGHRVPVSSTKQTSDSLNGIPLRALEDLSASERKDLMDYLTYLKSKR